MIDIWDLLVIGLVVWFVYSVVMPIIAFVM